MPVIFPKIAARQTRSDGPQTPRACRLVELRRRAEEAERRDRAAFLKYKGA